MLKYRKASFPKSVSTTFVAHCSPIRTGLFLVSEVVLLRPPCYNFQSIGTMNMELGEMLWNIQKDIKGHNVQKK